MYKNYYKRSTNADEVGRTQGRSAGQVSRRLLPAAGGRPEDGQEPLLGDQDQALKEVPGEGSSREAWGGHRAPRASAQGRGYGEREAAPRGRGEDMDFIPRTR